MSSNCYCNFPAVDNPRVYNYILDIALELDGEQSAQFKSKILEYAELEYQFSPYKYLELLAHWIAENQKWSSIGTREYTRSICS